MNHRRFVHVGLGLLAVAGMAVQCGAPAQTRVPGTATTVLASPAADTPTPGNTPALAASATTAATDAAPALTAVVTPTAQTTQVAPPQPDVLRVAVGLVETLDPLNSFGGSQAILGNVCERLLDHNPPGASSLYTFKLATGLTPSADGLTWTATLRPGVRFHDGTAFTAAAVKATILADKDHGQFGSSFGALTSMDTPDDQTVVFHLSSAIDLALILSAPYGSQIVSPKALAAVKADPKAYTKGLDGCTGPYTIKAVSQDVFQLGLNADYWAKADLAGRPNTVQVTYAPQAGEPALLRGGQADLALSMPNTETAKYQGDPTFTLYSSRVFQNYQIFLNTQRAPLDDKRVRQALAAAIDTDAIVAQLSKLQGVPFYPAHGAVPDGLYPNTPDVPQNHFDLAVAKQLLLDAGHPGGGFDLRLVYFDSNRVDSLIVPMVVQDLAQIGVHVKAQPASAGDIVKPAQSANPADHQDIFVLDKLAFRLDGGVEILAPFFHSSAKTFFNLSYFNNPTFDKLLDSALGQEAANPDAALAQYVQAQKLLVDEAPAVFLADGGATFAVPNYVKGFAYNPNYPSAIDYYSIYYGTGK